eukprot:363172-Chlamydomonas_euryale.AAC.5
MCVDVNGLQSYLASQASRASLRHTRSADPVAGSGCASTPETDVLAGMQIRDGLETIAEQNAAGEGLVAEAQRPHAGSEPHGGGPAHGTAGSPGSTPVAAASSEPRDTSAFSALSAASAFAAPSVRMPPYASPFGAAETEASAVLTNSSGSGSPPKGGGVNLHAGGTGTTNSAFGMSMGTMSLTGFDSTLSTVSTLGAALAPGCPPHGAKAVCGKRAKMEDAFSVQTHLIDLPAAFTDASPPFLPLRIADTIETGLRGSAGANTSGSSASGAALPAATDPSGAAAATPPDSERDALHFYGVYDGHGGVEAANHCAAKLHLHLSAAFATVVAGLPLEPLRIVTSSSLASGAASADAIAAAAVSADDEELSPGPIAAAAAAAAAVAAHAKAAAEGQSAPHLEGTRPPSGGGGADAGEGVRPEPSADEEGSVAAESTSSVESMGCAMRRALRHAFLKTDTEFAEVWGRGGVGQWRCE